MSVEKNRSETRLFCRLFQRPVPASSVLANDRTVEHDAEHDNRQQAVEKARHRTGDAESQAIEMIFACFALLSREV